MIRIAVGRALRWFVRQAASGRGSRRLLNQIYSLGPDQAPAWFERFGPALRGVAGVAPGEWRVRHAGRTVRLPVRGDHAAHDWEAALAFAGHEPEIKELYARLLPNLQPPVFFDVGSNLGHHSLLFLVHGVRCVSFEPNPVVRAYFDEACQLNGVSPHYENALAAAAGSSELSFPSEEPWLGSMSAPVRKGLAARSDVITINVECTTLDAVVQRTGLVPGLIKIDVEGSELQVLLGGRVTLRDHRPPIIFESWRDATRPSLFRELADQGYHVHALPLRGAPLNLASFEASIASNFAAFSPGYL